MNIAKWKLVLKILPVVVLLLTAKAFVHYFEIGIFPINALLTAIIAGNVFLLGFLLTGTLQDYKESERIPGDMAAALEAITDEMQIIYQNTKEKIAQEGIKHVIKISDLIEKWFYKEIDNLLVFEALDQLNVFFLAYEKLTQANFIVRMKQEQNNLRRMFIRAKTIRDTNFARSGYAVAEINVFLLSIAMVFLKMETIRESFFFVAVIAFLTNYILVFIKDIDNPFDYKRGTNDVDEISLQVLKAFTKRIENKLV